MVPKKFLENKIIESPRIVDVEKTTKKKSNKIFFSTNLYFSKLQIKSISKKPENKNKSNNKNKLFFENFEFKLKLECDIRIIDNRDKKIPIIFNILIESFRKIIPNKEGIAKDIFVETVVFEKPIL